MLVVTNASLVEHNDLGIDHHGRTPGVQAGYQLAGLIVTLVVALVSGAFTGWLLKFKAFDPPRPENYFDDIEYFEGASSFLGLDGPILPILLCSAFARCR